MKTSQIVLALGALMGVVFAITFALNYFGDTGTARPKLASVKELPQLDFENAYFPSRDSVLEWEQNKPGYANFWFRNPNAEPVRLGLVKKNCHCQKVELYLAPPEWLEEQINRNRILVAGPAVGCLVRG